ncbi:phage tail tape measure protein [Poseidonibacter lekithochrous]|uniref:phage tail tape measure protein n=1 Tax=Poseidonibacter lekithochrous TaxID=1904463 RepID=UPI000D3B176B|nr:phage tail tape measure protein [Poseidonibacter lekithochrous]
MEKLALSVIIGGAIASSFKSSMNSSTKSITQIGSEVHKMNKQKINIQKFKSLRKNAFANRKEFVKLGRTLKSNGVDVKNLSRYTSDLNSKLGKLKKNLIIKGHIQLEKNKLFEERDSLLATIGTGAAIGGVISLRSEILQAQGEIKSLGIGDIGISKITRQAKDFSNTFAGTTAPQFIKASYDIKSGISSLSAEAVGRYTRMAAITAGATKSSTTQMTSFFATGYGIYRKQYEQFASKNIEGWNKLSQEEKDIKFGEAFSAGIGSAVKMFKTDGVKMQSAIETLGASATTSNVPLSEQIAILGSMQKSFASGSEAATAYKGFLSGAVGASEDLGLSFLDSNNQLKNAPEILEQLRSKYGETLDDMEKQEIHKAFGTEEGLKFITSFYGEVDELKSSINGMDKSISNGTETINKMMEATQSGKGFQLLGQQIGNLGAAIGKILYPAVSVLGNAVGAVAVGLTHFIDTFPMLSTGIGYAVVGLFSFIAISKTAKLVSIAHRIAMISLRGSYLGNTKAVKGLIHTYRRYNIISTLVAAKSKAIAAGMFIANKAMGLAKIGVRTLIGATGIGLLLVAAGLVYEYWSPIKDFFSNLWGGIQERAMPFFNWIGEKINGIGSVISSIGSFFGFGDDGEEKSTKISKPGTGLKKAITATAATSQLVAAQPSLNYVKPKLNNVKKEVHQVNHIKVIVNNPTDNVQVEKAIVKAMKKSGTSRGLSDEDI